MDEKILALKIQISQTNMHFCIFDSSEAKNTFFQLFRIYRSMLEEIEHTLFFCGYSVLDEIGQNVIGRQRATELNQIVLFFHPSRISASEFVNCNKASFYLVMVFCKQMTKTA